MKYHQIFKASLYEFKKLAAFRLLSIGKVFTYVFFFVFFFTLISFSRFLLGDDVLFDASAELQEHSQNIGGLIYPMAFTLQLVISTLYVFIRVTIFAYIGSLLLKLTKRRGQFLHIWRTSAIAMTVPILLTIALDFSPELETTGLMISSMIHLLYISLAIKYYPKQPVAKRN